MAFDHARRASRIAHANIILGEVEAIWQYAAASSGSFRPTLMADVVELVYSAPPDAPVEFVGEEAKTMEEGLEGRLAVIERDMGELRWSADAEQRRREAMAFALECVPGGPITTNVTVNRAQAAWANKEPPPEIDRTAAVLASARLIEAYLKGEGE